MKTRQCKTISFNLMDDYEVRLLNHSLEKVHGDFSKYIKRLISRDVDNLKQVVNVAYIEEIEEDDSDAMNGFT